MKKVRVAALIALFAVAITGCGLAEGDVFAKLEPDATGAPPPTRGEAIQPGPSVDDAIPHIQRFWTDSYAKVARSGSFKPLPPDRIFGLRPGEEAGPCDDEYAFYEDDVIGNAFAANCPEGAMVVYDARRLFGGLRRRYGGLGPAIVLAHEWGHIVQFQARVQFREEVFAEQQADCFAGAWFAAAKSDFPELASKAALDRTIGALIEFRDEPGIGPREDGAHGSGFDRVRAFQEGYERGVEHCATYSRNPPTLVQLPFSSAADAASGGNLPYDELEPGLIESLNLYAQSLLASAPQPTQVAPLRSYKSTCDGAKVKTSDGPVLVCTKESVIVVDAADLRAEVDNYGDGAVSVRFAVKWAELLRVAAGETPDDGSIGPRLQQLCLAGGWFQTLIKAKAGDPLRFSPGDLDEAIAALSSAAESGSLGEGELFEAIAAMRQGVIEGGKSCGLGR